MLIINQSWLTLSIIMLFFKFFFRPFGKSPRCDGEDELCTLNGVLKIGNQGIQFYVQYGKERRIPRLSANK